jgi:hypothetical protein
MSLDFDLRTTVECGLGPNAPDYAGGCRFMPERGAMLVTADKEFPDDLGHYQREHNDCCWGLILLPSDELKQIEVLKRVRAGELKIKHFVDRVSARLFACPRLLNRPRVSAKA